MLIEKNKSTKKIYETLKRFRSVELVKNAAKEEAPAEKKEETKE